MPLLPHPNESAELGAVAAFSYSLQSVLLLGEIVMKKPWNASNVNWNVQEQAAAALLLERSWHPTNILDPVTETLTEPAMKDQFAQKGGGR